MKIYVIIDAVNGEDYTSNEPNLLFISSNGQEAKDFFNDEIANWEDGMGSHDSHTTEYESGLVYECIDFDDDSYRMIKLITKEVSLK